MEDILFSPQQFYALVGRLNELKNDVTAIKLKASPETSLIDERELAILLKVTTRTLFRWRTEGRLPFLRLGKKPYYNLDLILSNFKTLPNSVVGAVRPPVIDHEPDDAAEEITCIRCPLFLAFDS